MPEKLTWTDQRDTWLKRLRAQGLAWDAIAAALGISRNAAIERGRRIGARLPPPEHRPEPDDPERPPLPPGHAASWGAIVAGTCLEDTPYPLPRPLDTGFRRGCPGQARAAPAAPRAQPPADLRVPPAHAAGERDRTRAALRAQNLGAEPAPTAAGR